MNRIEGKIKEQGMVAISSSLFVLFLLTFFAIFHHSYCESVKDVGTIREACRHVGNWTVLCISSLESDSQSFEANFHGLVRISIEHASANGTATFHYIQDLLSKITDPYVKRVVSLCSEQYEIGVNRVSTGLAQFDKNQFDEAAALISICSAGAYTCGQAYAPLPGHDQDLVRRNDLVRGLCTIATALVEELY